MYIRLGKNGRVVDVLNSPAANTLPISFELGQMLLTTSEVVIPEPPEGKPEVYYELDRNNKPVRKRRKKGRPQFQSAVIPTKVYTLTDELEEAVLASVEMKVAEEVSLLASALAVSLGASPLGVPSDEILKEVESELEGEYNFLSMVRESESLEELREAANLRQKFERKRKRKPAKEQEKPTPTPKEKETKGDNGKALGKDK